MQSRVRGIATFFFWLQSRVRAATFLQWQNNVFTTFSGLGTATFFQRFNVTYTDKKNCNVFTTFLQRSHNVSTTSSTTFFFVRKVAYGGLQRFGWRCKVAYGAATFLQRFCVRGLRIATSSTTFLQRFCVRGLRALWEWAGAWPGNLQSHGGGFQG